MKVSELFESGVKSVNALLGAKHKKFQDHVNTFDCSYSGITTLKGSPSIVDKTFDCSNNKLTTLEGGPSKVDGNYMAYSNKLLTSLEGGPSYVGERLELSFCGLTSLHNIHKIINHIGDGADFTKNPIKSHVLGLLLIDGLEQVWFNNKKVQSIINKHLKGDRDVFECQEELIEAGLDEYAQL